MVDEEITIKVNGEKRRVLRSDYVTAKTKQLREFGYPRLLESEVSAQLDKILAKKPLNVTGKFMEDDIVI